MICDMNLYDGSEEKEANCGQDGQQSRYHAKVQPQAVDLIHPYTNIVTIPSFVPRIL